MALACAPGLFGPSDTSQLGAIGNVWHDIGEVVGNELPPSTCCGVRHDVEAEVVVSPTHDAWEFRIRAWCAICHSRYFYGQHILPRSYLITLEVNSGVKAITEIGKRMVYELKDEILKQAPSLNPANAAQAQKAQANATTINKILQQAYLPAITAQLNSPALFHEPEPKADTEQATIAEWITKRLVEAGGKLHVSKLGGLDWKPQRIIDVADEMGFVQWPHLRLPEEHPLAA
jgi:hypothetical protein